MLQLVSPYLLCLSRYNYLRGTLSSFLSLKKQVKLQSAPRSGRRKYIFDTRNAMVTTALLYHYWFAYHRQRNCR